MRNILLVIIFITLTVVGLLIFNFVRDNQPEILPENYKEVTFGVSGVPVTMKNGVADAITSLGGTSKTVIRYFGNELEHDIDGDGVNDMVFLITQEAFNESIFFYLVGALKRKNGYIGTHALYIGDKIAPQTTEKGEGRMVIVNYAVGENPSVGKSLYLLLDTTTLEFGEVVQNFEGESR